MTQGPIPPTSQPTPISYGAMPPGFNVPDFLAFRIMITVPLIKLLYLLGTGLTILFALIAMVVGLFQITEGGIFIILGGIFMLVVGPIIVRLQCEMMIVIFKINESLIDIHRELQKR